jgi:hypothetical protein
MSSAVYAQGKPFPSLPECSRDQELAFFDKIVFVKRDRFSKFGELVECKVQDDPAAFNEPIRINELLEDCLGSDAKRVRADDVKFVDFAAVCVEKESKDQK